MAILYIVLGFLLPVIMVFGYSVWLNRRRRISGGAEFVGDPEKKAFSAIVQRCATLKNSANKDNATNIEEDIDSVLVKARSLQDQNLRERSLSQVMSVYVAMGRDKEARALLSEVKDEANRANILEEVFGHPT
jgi:hypothetical protein